MIDISCGDIVDPINGLVSDYLKARQGVVAAAIAKAVALKACILVSY